MSMQETPTPVAQVESDTPETAPVGAGANHLPKATKRPSPPPVPSDARSTIIAGALIVGVTFLGLGGWAASAPLASGVIAIGSVVFEGRRQVVQHFEGGIIAEIRVREGDRVEQGDVLLRLDPTQPMSRVARIRNLYETTAAQAARLRAEAADLPEITFPADLMAKAGDPEIANVLSRERSVFDERRRSLEGQLGLLATKAVQLEREIEGLDAQEESNADQIVLINREVDDLRPLLEQGLVQRPRVTALEREAARLRGASGEITAQRARANEGIAETKLQAEQIHQRFREDVVALLREAENQLSDLNQQLVSATDVFDRLEVRAPQTGTAQNVNVTTLGSVIRPGDDLLQIAPTSDRLLVEARVSPQDIDSVTAGQRAEVRLSALDLKRTPAVFGDVISVSGDRFVDARMEAEYFLVQINVPQEELDKLGGQSIQAGMPAEVVFPTGERTLLNYLIKPLTDAMARGLNER